MITLNDCEKMKKCRCCSSDHSQFSDIFIHFVSSILQYFFVIHYAYFCLSQPKKNKNKINFVLLTCMHVWVFRINTFLWFHFISRKSIKTLWYMRNGNGNITKYCSLPFRFTVFMFGIFLSEKEKKYTTEMVVAGCAGHNSTIICLNWWK